jgi:hypothetical protein
MALTEMVLGVFGVLLCVLARRIVLIDEKLDKERMIFMGTQMNTEARDEQDL